MFLGALDCEARCFLATSTAVGLRSMPRVSIPCAAMKAASHPYVRRKLSAHSALGNEVRVQAYPPAARNERLAVLERVERDAHVAPVLVEQLPERRLDVACVPRRRLRLPCLIPACARSFGKRRKWGARTR